MKGSLGVGRASEQQTLAKIWEQKAGEETRWQLHKNVESNIEQVLVTTPHKTPTIRPLASHHENYTS